MEIMLKGPGVTCKQYSLTVGPEAIYPNPMLFWKNGIAFLSHDERNVLISHLQSEEVKDPFIEFQGWSTLGRAKESSPGVSCCNDKEFGLCIEFLCFGVWVRGSKLVDLRLVRVELELAIECPVSLELHLIVEVRIDLEFLNMFGLLGTVEICYGNGAGCSNVLLMSGFNGFDANDLED
ncbi:hypothetical protein Droror1_Dr00009917 [Drosera rotundifolia]